MEKKVFVNQVKKVCIILFLIIIGGVGALNASMKAPTFMEVDSYVMPIISLQHRGSLIIEPQDIEQAKIDFPSLYANVNTYDDFRSSKLVKIDDNHWIACYFPAYAFICMPMKLLLSFLKLNQIQCFSLTNFLLFWCALCFLIKYYSKEKMEGLACAILMCCSPIWLYLQYIGAEPIMFSLAVYAYLLWKNRKYKFAALTISVASMMNPTFMGIGIVMFFEYVYSTYKMKHRFILQTSEIKSTLGLCACYIPSLIPFAFNKITVNQITLITPRLSKENELTESVFRRFLAYLFDLNLGIASISVFITIVLLIAIGYSIYRKNMRLIFEWSSVIFVILCFSLMPHINCSMLNCARYVMWIYPGVILVICDFAFEVFYKSYKKSLSVLGICSISCLLIARMNGIYTYLQFNNVSQRVLNHVPWVYMSMCDSTFNSRSNHIDGGYDLSGISIYSDSKTGEVRKIMLYNTKTNRESLCYMLESSQDTDKKMLENQLINKPEGKICTINIGRGSAVQYKERYNEVLYNWVSSYIDSYGGDGNMNLKAEIAAGLLEDKEDAYQAMYKCVPKNLASKEEYVHWLYSNLINRIETAEENSAWNEKNMSRYDIFVQFIQSEEFKLKHGMYIR